MATNKTYTVVKNGVEMKELKTLAAAKRLADEQSGEVLCEGTVVYTATSPIESEIEATAEVKDSEKYTLLSKMNVRTSPSLKADKVGVAEAGTIVEVLAIEDDWLRVRNGAGVVFILYGSGKYARKN
jgi:uncharacterized protein YgiM (DUF1202 family)